jgi:LmbE family N-acetylglucosaminyl deacetylase
MKTPRLALPRGTLLVLAAHPDDEALGAGAVLAAHARAGGRAVAAFATDGSRGRPARLRGPRLAALRRREARRAAAVLGAECEFWGLADGSLDRDKTLPSRVGEAVSRLRPALVLAPAQDDPHPDHRALARAVRAPHLCYEATGPAVPDLLFDAGRALPAKLAALRAHATQERAHRWSIIALRRAAALALLAPGLRYAEGFRRPANRS